MVTLAHPDLDSISAPWLSAPAPRAGAVYGGRLQGVLSGPDGTLVELIGA
jgi:hypothetical protein